MTTPSATLTSISGPPVSVSEVGDAVRELLPLHADGKGGYLIRCEREGAGVHVWISLMEMSTGLRYVGDRALGDFTVHDPAEIPPCLSSLDLPTCSCGCGCYVVKEGKRHGYGGFFEGTHGNQKEFCLRGHPLNDETTRKKKGGGRECLECKRIRKREARFKPTGEPSDD